MTDLKLIINNTDFSGIVEKGSYVTGKVPIVGTKYTDLNKVDHTTIARYRNTLDFKTNVMSPAQVTSLFTALCNAPCEVQFFSFQDGANITATMIPSFDDVQDAAKRSSGHWVRGLKVTLTEE